MSQRQLMTLRSVFRAISPPDKLLTIIYNIEPKEMILTMKLMVKVISFIVLWGLV